VVSGAGAAALASPYRGNSKWSRPMNVIDQAKNAAAFIEDRTHEQHLDKLLWMMRTRRDEAARRVPEWEQLRDLASQIKEHTLSNLAHYLEMFESNARVNGVTVHWALDGHEHSQIVYQILRDRKVDALIKSKSMLTEECDTRRFLQERGIVVSETDLGERISHFRAPRRNGEMHIILVDNGRSSRLGMGEVLGIAQVHPLRGLHEHLSGLPPERLAQLRLNLHGPHPNHHDADF
jgi:L-lactate utilization protein LutB